MKRNIRLTIEYDGSRYQGWQRLGGDSSANTIQGKLEAVLSKMTGEDVNINGSGRTDAGVHAEEYCFSCMTDREIPCRNFVRGMNGYLPDDISILSCEDVPESFHARFSCVAKEYVYRIHNSESKNPFQTDLALHYRRAMQIDLMQEAANHFIGTHDFGSFCSNCTEDKNTVRTIYKFNIEMQGDSVLILVKGDGFLYNMIRILIGTLLSVNEGSIAIKDLDAILAARDRTLAGRTVQPHGLYLHRVYYA